MEQNGIFCEELSDHDETLKITKTVNHHVQNSRRRKLDFQNASPAKKKKIETSTTTVNELQELECDIELGVEVDIIKLEKYRTFFTNLLSDKIVVNSVDKPENWSVYTSKHHKEIVFYDVVRLANPDPAKKVMFTWQKQVCLGEN